MPQVYTLPTGAPPPKLLQGTYDVAKIVLGSRGHRNNPVTVLRAPCKVEDTGGRRPITVFSVGRDQVQLHQSPGERGHTGRRPGRAWCQSTKRWSMAGYNPGGGLGSAQQAVPQGQSFQMEFVAESGQGRAGCGDLACAGVGCGGTVYGGGWQIWGCRSRQGPRLEIRKHSGGKRAMAMEQSKRCWAWIPAMPLTDSKMGQVNGKSWKLLLTFGPRAWFCLCFGYACSWFKHDHLKADI